MHKLILAALCGAGLFLAGFSMGRADTAARVFELRVYTTAEGKLPDLLARFRNHTTALFEKHGITNVGYWVPATDDPKSKNTLVYLLAHKNRGAAKASWDAFRADPEWIKVKTESEAPGKIVEKVESTYLNPTDFSKLK